MRITVLAVVHHLIGWRTCTCTCTLHLGMLSQLARLMMNDKLRQRRKLCYRCCHTQWVCTTRCGTPPCANPSAWCFAGGCPSAGQRSLPKIWSSVKTGPS